jgi:hypothetical protein
MRLRSSWLRGRNIVVGYLTDEPPHGSAEAPVLIEITGNVVPPSRTLEVNVFLPDGVDSAMLALIREAEKVGYRIVPRDDRQMPAPRLNLHLRIAPGTEGE